MRVQPVFEAIKWAGVAYLVYLGAQAICSAVRGQYAPLGSDGGTTSAAQSLAGWRQGFISNITNVGSHRMPLQQPIALARMIIEFISSIARPARRLTGRLA